MVVDCSLVFKMIQIILRNQVCFLVFKLIQIILRNQVFRIISILNFWPYERTYLIISSPLNRAFLYSFEKK